MLPRGPFWPPLALLLALGTGCRSAPAPPPAPPPSPPPTHELLVGMAELDAAFLPALWLTGQPDRRGDALVAMDGLDAAWPAFRARHASSPVLDAGATAELDEVERSIAEAGRLLRDAGDAAAARELLEGMRSSLAELRARHGLDYYLDLLIAHHGAVDGIARTAADAGLGVDELRARLTELLAQARRSWDRVLSARPEASVFGLSPEAEQERRRLVLAEHAALDRLEAALRDGDADALRAAGRAVEPPHARQVLLFARLPEGVPGPRSSEPAG